MMDGNMEVESRPGEGSAFRFTIRMNIGSRCDPGLDARLPKEPQNLRVLIVDDNEHNRAVLQYKVDSWGMRNESAESGPLALDKLREARSEGGPFDIAILDMMMPGMDGIELARAIKADLELRDTKLVLLTSVSYASPDTLKEAGISASLNKPARSSALYNCMIGLCGMGRANRNAPPGECARTGLSGRLLLAEDNPVNQEVTRGMIRYLGCELDTVENGELALQALSQSRYDLVLMDCQMPEMDGYTATRIIREKEKLGEFGAQPIRIVALTAHAMAEAREQCMAAGMDDYLGKPFTLQQLHDTLRRWMDPEKQASGPEKASNAGRAANLTAERQPAPKPHPQTLDPGILGGIRSLGTEGMPDVLEKVIAIYMENSPLLMDKLRQAISSRDASAIQFAAHSLKSGNANVGALELAGLCGELEQLGRSGRTEAAPEILARVEKTYPLVVEALKAEIKGGSN